MKKLSFILSVIVLLPLHVSRADNIFSLIRDGKLDEAADSLSDVTTASTRDGNRLFYRSLLEGDADQSARLMEAALRSSVAPIYRQEIYYRLALYHLLKEDYTRLSELVSEYRTHWENGKYRAEMQRLSILIDERHANYDAAIKQSDRYLLEYSSGEANHWGMVDKARIMRRFDKDVGAHNMLRKLSREKSGPGVAVALYMLAEEAIRQKHTDDAVFYYNLLREAYPAAIGLDALMEKMENLTYSGDNRAEKLTGTFYSVQVGVFSVKDNAEKQADMFKQYNQKVEIRQKNVSDVKYHVVYVGRFTDYEEARRFKTMLESNHKEAYQVVAR
ncbi:MAG: SPOR domain-containing protein [Candidatus Zixiibacteriota bacterium]